MPSENDSQMNISQKIMSQLDDISSDFPVIQDATDDSEDDFEKLLNDFISAEKEETSVQTEVRQETLMSQESNETQVSSVAYGVDERELAQAYQNFFSSVTAIAVAHKVKMPEMIFKPESLIPNYKPSLGRKINADIMAGWDVMLKSFKDEMASLSPNSSDEEFLNFAENLTDQDLQLAVISYIEILIDVENCEISYEERRIKAQRRRIERELYEEFQRRRERKQRFIEALKKQNFPIDAERLINNYFKTANKDPEGAFRVLITNPAVYAPIETDKIKSRFFGLIKPTPEDGIRENHRIGAFLKKMKA